MISFSEEGSTEKDVFYFDTEKIKNIVQELLLALGENPERPELKETPQRVAFMWRDFLGYDPGKIDTCFESVSTDQMVIVSGMRVHSMCEHHLLPFTCDITIGYIAREKVLGLSKFARIAHKHAHKLQLQERLCEEIADDISAITRSPDVAVIGKGEHSCMIARGIKTPALMTSSVMRGLFRTESAVRAEFLQLLS